MKQFFFNLEQTTFGRRTLLAPGSEIIFGESLYTVNGIFIFSAFVGHYEFVVAKCRTDKSCKIPENGFKF